MVALLTLGEGYHSFHHRFPVDYRNGIQWYQWDPAKWFIRGLRAVGLASELRAVDPPQIEHARIRAAIRLVEPKIASIHPKRAEDIRRRINKAVAHLETAIALWRQHIDEKAAGVSKSWRETRRRSRKYVRQSRRQWKNALRILSRVPDAA